MERVIVLVMHGSPPNDFPKQELAELLDLPGRIRSAAEEDRAALAERLGELEARIRAWPRSAGNDPFWAGSQTLGHALAPHAKGEVIVAFNEFCAPTVDEAIDMACRRAPEKVIVTTAMVTRGGSHAEDEIPESIEAARAKHPDVDIVYAWPFRATDIAQFIASQIDGYLKRGLAG